MSSDCKSMRKGKRGQVIHLLAYGLAVVFVAIGFLFLSLFIDQVNGIIQSNDQFGQQQKDQLGDINTTLPKVLDASYAFLIVGAAMALVASVLFINTSIIFMFITMPIFLIVLLANAIFANMIDEFGNSSALVDIYANFPFMQFFAGNWVTVVVVVGFVTIFAFFAGKSVGGGGEQ